MCYVLFHASRDGGGMMTGRGKQKNKRENPAPVPLYPL
jgi:hypothetical protein